VFDESDFPQQIQNPPIHFGSQKIGAKIPLGPKSWCYDIPKSPEFCSRYPMFTLVK